MTATVERTRQFSKPDIITVSDLLSEVPDTVTRAMLESERSGMAKTPEGTLVLSFLFANRDLMKPALKDGVQGNTNLITPTGGHDYNPHRTIDAVGEAIFSSVAERTRNLPELMVHTEEHEMWEPAGIGNASIEDADRFAIIDPLDMTHSLTKGDRIQTSGIAIYNRAGQLKALGVVSLVDDGMLFIEHSDTKKEPTIHFYETNVMTDTSDEIIRIGTLTRRMYDLRSLPLFSHEGIWKLDCTSGYALLRLMNNDLDTIVDPVKGFPWYEFAIWGTAAQTLGYPVTDGKGNPIDTAAMIRYVIKNNPTDSYRIPFVMSRTPEIHKRVLSLLQPTNAGTPARS